MTGTLTLYVARRFALAFAAAFFSVLLLVMLVDLVEQSRRAAGGRAGFETVAVMAMLHAPSLMLEILPFLALLASMACYARLARSSELVVTRAAGVSVWRLIAPALACALIIGSAGFAVLNPVAAGMLQRFETLEARFIRDRTSLLSVSENGLWLRWSSPGGQSVIHALGANRDGTRLRDVTVFRFDEDDELTGRMSASRAVLEPGVWTLHEVALWRFEPNGDAAADAPAAPAEGDASPALAGAEGLAEAPRRGELDRLQITTDLTPDQILESFASPRTIGFWELPGFIDALETAGLSATRHRMHLQSQTALPALLAAMVLIGAAFSMRHVRFGGLGLMAIGAVGAGLGYFFLANLTSAFGASGVIAPSLAAWIPPIAVSLMALALILHWEDG
ncbi:MAG: LPS export ABC transporter permease LptG [Pseudomonadota bacterium]